MSPERINRTIHSLRGLPIMTDGWVPSYNDPDNFGGHPEAEPLPVPDYLNDLNAIHEAEKVMTTEQKREYVRNLFRKSQSDFESHCATTAQRAEALLRTLNKWEDAR